MYTHYSCVEEFYNSLESVVTRDMRHELDGAPFVIFGIEAAEATDASYESTVIEYVRQVHCT